MSDIRNIILQEFVQKLLLLIDKNQLPPWQKPWNEGATTNQQKPYNPLTQQFYQGINSLHLSLTAELNHFLDPRWVGFNQANKAGWSIRSQQKGTVIYLPIKKIIKADVRDGQGVATNTETAKDRISYRLTRVFNAEQISGIPPLEKSNTVITEFKNHNPLPIIAQRLGVSVIETSSDLAYYSPHLDMIKLPLSHQFTSIYGRESTFAHELTHASGSIQRLARDQTGQFGSRAYCIEEITAEIGAFLLCRELELHFTAVHPDQTQEQHLSYTAHWIELLKKETVSIELAIKQALEATKFLYQQWQIEQMIQQFQTVNV
ncbi:DNA primase TraC [Ferrovum sp. JA12]|uniref:zincin-like metallopeptidase domain-containing protein n=1 Tax=Ferrovum sp. JA12 TaxID=1356299 RepID=UPI0007038358|nr:zincin-like metallopeptidase domain-containing protein [Ferrovum sp. JA12]KRH78268.1 DNA primase TraC [Ferrovum sp. JA12]